MADSTSVKVEDDVTVKEEQNVENAEGEAEEEDAGEGENEAEDAEEGKAESEDKKAKKELKTNKVVIDWDKLTLDEMLQQKILLSDDTEHGIFSRGPKYSDEQWPITCHICRQGNILTEEALRIHVKSRRHQQKEYGRLADAKSYLEPFYQVHNKEIENCTPIKIFPGEIIEELTGEYADRVIKKEDFEPKKPSDEIIQKLEKDPMYEYNQKLPLIGLCYIYKMQGFQGSTYFCLLCNEKIKGEAFAHIVDADHQARYIVRHFPKLYERVTKELKNSKRPLNIQFCVRNIFRKLYRKIENVKGFVKMTICDDDDFFKNRKRYLLKMRFDDHYDEDTVIITDHEVDVLIRKCQNGVNFIKADLISLDNPKLGFRDEVFHEIGGGDRRSRGGSDATRWAKYREAMEREVAVLNREYQRYDRYPKTHAKYEGEMNKYKSFKNDPKMRMSFQAYWSKRLRALYENDLNRIKSKTKRALGLRGDARSPTPDRRGGGPGPGCFPPENVRDMLAYQIQRQMQETQQQQMELQRQQQQFQMIQQQRLREAQLLQQQEAEMRREPLGVISVLRLFTAFENQLGSMGPQANKLLARAVLAEKNNENPNDLMMENEYYVFVVTAKEKLKGQLVANVIEGNVIGSVRKAISDADTLLEMFEDYMRRNGKRIRTEPEKEVVPIQQIRAPISNDFGSSSSSSYQNQNRGGTDFSSDQNLSSKNNYSSGGSFQGNSGGGNNFQSNRGNDFANNRGSNNYSSMSSGGNNYSSGGGGGGGYGGNAGVGGNNYSSGNGFSSNSSGNNYQSGVGKTGSTGGFQDSSNYQRGAIGGNNYSSVGGGGGNQSSWQSGSNSNDYRSNNSNNQSSLGGGTLGGGGGRLGGMNSSNTKSYDPSFYQDSYSFKSNNQLDNRGRNNY